METKDNAGHTQQSKNGKGIFVYNLFSKHEENKRIYEG